MVESLWLILMHGEYNAIITTIMVACGYVNAILSAIVCLQMPSNFLSIYRWLKMQSKDRLFRFTSPFVCATLLVMAAMVALDWGIPQR